MPNSHHFYSTNRGAGRGGIDVDESTLDPNANYWRMFANGELVKLQKMIGDEAGRAAIENIEGTWKEIYECIALKVQEALALQIVCGVSSQAWWDAQEEVQF